MEIRLAAREDRDDIWSIIEPVIRQADTYTLPQDMTKDDALAYWTSAEKQTFVAVDGGAVLGTYYLKTNQLGGGSHVANCGYITGQGSRGRGIARAMCDHSLKHAREQGFHAMQFNFVVSSNERAVRLWQSLGFDIVGTLPAAFRHLTGKKVDAFVMYRLL